LLIAARQWLACAFRRFASLEEATILEAWWWRSKSSGAIASRRGFFMSSLPGLTRQSMESGRLLRFTGLFDSRQLGMDHRVLGGAKRRRSSNGYARW
jgi:hypothetical protein